MVVGALLALITPVRGSIFGDDIPGDGQVRCGFPNLSSCVLSPAVGTVTGQTSGALTNGSSTLGLNLSTVPLFLTFSGGDPIFGPLGLNPAFHPTKISSVSGN